MAAPFIRRRSAYSLLFAFVMSTLYLLFISNAASRTQTLLREMPSQAAYMHAQLTAQMAAQLGFQSLSGHTFGYEPRAEEVICTDTDLDGECETWGAYEVRALAALNTQENDGNFYLPMPGTGTAGNADFCFMGRDHYDADHPCNWNTWRYGETVVLPLFVDDGLGGVSLPVQRGFRSLTFRLRTPCSNGQDLTDYAECERSLLNLDGAIETEGDTLVNWELSALTTGGEELSLSADDRASLAVSGRSRSNLTRRGESFNNEFYELQLNEGVESGTYVMDEIDSAIPWADFNALLMRSDLREIYLNLHLSAPLVDEASVNVPRLEYQFIYDADQSFPDNKILAWGSGFSRFLGQVFAGEYFLTQDLTGLDAGDRGLSN